MQIFKIIKEFTPKQIRSFVVGTATFVAFIVGAFELFDRLKPNPKNLSGEWIIVNNIKEAKMKKYVGLHITFRIFISQDKDKITGKGEKILVNNDALKFSERTSFTIEGSVEGNQVKASFTDYGTNRTSTGAFNWEIIDNGKIKGIFSSTASDSYGASEGEKVQKL